MPSGRLQHADKSKVGRSTRTTTLPSELAQELGIDRPTAKSSKAKLSRQTAADIGPGSQAERTDKKALFRQALRNQRLKDNVSHEELESSRTERISRKLDPVSKSAKAVKSSEGLPKRRRSLSPESAEISWLEYQLKGKRLKGSIATQVQNEEGDDLNELLSSLDTLEHGLGIGADLSDGSSDEETSCESASTAQSDADDLQLTDEDKTPVVQRETSSGYVPISQRLKFSNAEAQASPDSSKPDTSSRTISLLEQFPEIVRDFKRIINRISPSSLSVLTPNLHQAFKTYPRAHATQVLVELTVLEKMLGPEQQLLYCTIACAMQRLEGVDVGASMLAALIDRLDSQQKEYDLQRSSETEVLSALDALKTRLFSTLAMLGHFFVLGGTSQSLIYDLIRSILLQFDVGMAVEAILVLVRVTGPTLRSSDPTGLKDIVSAVQTSIHSKQSATEEIPLRTRFLLETLINLRNNKTKHASFTDQDAVGQMLRFLQSLGKTFQLRSVEPIRASLDEMREAGSTGKWWLVGAAWGGDPLAKKTIHFGKASQASRLNGEDGIEALARKQGMNTEVRRNIFRALITAEDYLDAREKINNLSLNEKQRREIVRVLLHCSGHEKTYNPFYTLVFDDLLSSGDANNVKITVQYAVWDFLRDLGQVEVAGMAVLESGATSTGQSVTRGRRENIARMLGWCIGRGSLSLNMFKPVAFNRIHPKFKLFFRYLLVHLLLATQTSSPLGACPSNQPHVATLITECFTGIPIRTSLHDFLQEEVTQESISSILGADCTREVANVIWALGKAIQILDSSI